MSKGCVVIASDIENHREIITHGENGYLIPDDCLSLDLLINTLKEDKEKLKKVSTKAKEFVSNNYGIASLLKLELEDYNKLLKS